MLPLCPCVGCIYTHVTQLLISKLLLRVSEYVTDFLVILLQVELHVHLDGAIRPETILHFGR